MPILLGAQNAFSGITGVGIELQDTGSVAGGNAWGDAPGAVRHKDPAVKWAARIAINADAMAIEYVSIGVALVGSDLRPIGVPGGNRRNADRIGSAGRIVPG